MKAPWHKGATYTYTCTPDGDGLTYIEFRFPNAPKGALVFRTWLYWIDRKGIVISKNMAAEMLQCYIDKPIDGIKTPSRCQKLRHYIKRLIKKIPGKA